VSRIRFIEAAGAVSSPLRLALPSLSSLSSASSLTLISFFRAPLRSVRVRFDVPRDRDGGGVTARGTLRRIQVR
jgi:hypothetical protein